MEVVILHEPDDLDSAERIAAGLRELGYTTWSSDNVEVGDQPAREISERLAAGGPVVICGTKKLAGSAWLAGLVAAVKGPQLHDFKRLFPVRMEVGAYLEAHMRGAKIADCGTNFEKGMKDLLAALSSRFPLEPDNTQAVLVESDRRSRDANFDGWLSSSGEFSEEHLRRYRERLRPEVREKLSDALSSVEFLERANLARNGRLFGAGILLFTEHPESLAPTAYIQCARFRGRDRASAQENKELYGPAVEQIEGAMDFVASRIEKSEILEPGEMASKPDYQFPMICFREVLANAICHRDYADQNRHVYVRLFENRIEVSNPGSWVAQPIASGREFLLEELRSEPASRNERLAAALRRIQFVETQGSGIDNAVSDCLEEGADIPKVKYEAGMTVVTIFPRRNWDSLSIQRRERAIRSKPALTGSSHKLPFEKLAPGDFERLCLWLVSREGYSRAVYAGNSKSERGRDVMAWKGGRRIVFHCRRVKKVTPAYMRAEIKKLQSLPAEEQPQELVFVVPQVVTAETRSAARAAWGEEATCHFWSGGALDELIKRHPDLLAEFFQLPPERRRAAFVHLPYASLGELFQGREEMLSRLRESLVAVSASRATAIAGKTIHGLGGVGKTRLAIEYAWQYAAEYSAVLFVSAESPEDLRRNLATLCTNSVLDLPEQESKEEEVRVAAVVRWLQENPGWLLILDNVDSEKAAAAVDALISRLHGGHILLTGRLARWSAEVEPIELDVLTEEAAAGFLLARTNRRRRVTKEDSALAAALAKELGFLPLALEQAGAYIAERRLTLAAYLDEWRSQHDQVLTWFDPRVSHYSKSIAVTWQTSFDRLSAPARRLLQRLAWLGPEPIPESLLDVPVLDLSESELTPDLREVLVELEAYSLVTRAAEAPTFAVHPLVQDITRRSLRNDANNGPLTETLHWVNAAFVGDPQDVRTWPTLDPLAPHTRAIVVFADAANIIDPTGQLMSQLAQLLDAKALPAEAEPLMRRALAIDEKSFGTAHPNVAIHLNNLAALLKATNRLAEAEPLMRRALAIDEKSFGPEHPEVAIDLNNLAQLLQVTNRLTEAEPLIRRALAINEISLGPNHPKVAIRLNNLAQLLQATNRLAEAEPLMMRAVSIFESSFGERHPTVATALNNLAQLFRVSNRLAEAEPLVRRALAIDEECFGPDHPNVATDLNNLAQLFQSTNRFAEAEPLMRRALAIDEKSFGPGHPEIARDLNNLAALLQGTNRLAEAEPLMRQALMIDEQSFGPEHPNVAIDLNNLAQLLWAANRLAEAEPLMLRHLIIFLDFTRRTGHEHPHLQNALGNYSSLLQAMGKSDAEIKATIEALVRAPE